LKEKPILKFSFYNAKLGKETMTFSLPSGYTCPGARDCLAKANPKTGKITDGEFAKFRCFSAVQEAAFPAVRHARWHNKKVLQEAGSKTAMAELLINQIKKKSPKRVRIHVAGDFFSEAYFKAWVEVAKAVPETVFYAYTKSLPYWMNNITDIPSNFILTASRGGKFDHIIDRMELKEAVVVFHPSEAEKLGLPIDHDDSNAYSHNKSFALLLHGQQKKDSVASEAKKRMDAEGIEYSYGKKRGQSSLFVKTKNGFDVFTRSGGKITFEEEKTQNKKSNSRKVKEPSHGTR
jgi:hypothetical protein